MPPLFTPSSFTVRRHRDNVCVLSPAAYLWKVSSHQRAPLPTHCFILLRCPGFEPGFSPESACCPSAALLRLNVTRSRTPSVRAPNLSPTCSKCLRNAEAEEKSWWRHTFRDEKWSLPKITQEIIWTDHRRFPWLTERTTPAAAPQTEPHEGRYGPKPQARNSGTQRQRAEYRCNWNKCQLSFCKPLKHSLCTYPDHFVDISTTCIWADVHVRMEVSETTVPHCVSTSVSVKPLHVLSETSGCFPVTFMATKPETAKQKQDFGQEVVRVIEKLHILILNMFWGCNLDNLIFMTLV